MGKIASESALKTSNPGAVIAFVIYYPFQFYVYKNVYELLKTDAEFIVDLCHPFSNQEQERLLGDIVRLLESHNVPYRVLHPEDYFHKKYLERFFSQYTALVSVWEKGCMKIATTANINKINLTYGAGKELTMVRPSRGLYDLILSYGPRDTKLFSYYTYAEMVGNPKFDDWFNNTIDMKGISGTYERLNKKKKTVLYLPTYGDLSSVDALARELKQLSVFYNVIVKLHYYMTREEPVRVKKLEHPEVILLADDVDLLPLLKLADVVVSDNSSAIFDAILADKPIVVADFWDEDFFDTQHKEMRIYTRGKQGALTYSDSIEQVIKREGKVITLKTPHDLEEKVKEALRDDMQFKQARATLREELFAFNDGKCSERAATAIRARIADTQPRTRPILYHAIEAYKQKTRDLSYGRERVLTKKIADYELALGQKVSSEKPGTVFSVILLPGAKVEASNQYESLRSIVEQKFPADKFEIVLVGKSQKEIEDIIASIPTTGATSPRIRGTATESDSVHLLGRQISDAIKQSDGNIICFAVSDCTLPADWLLSLSLAYERHPDVGGVGGYVRTAKEAYTIFDEYEYRRLGKKLNVPLKQNFLRRLYEVKNRLLEQNPAGALATISYKRESLPGDFSSVQRLPMLERYLKIEVMKSAPVCFIPRYVTRVSHLTMAAFWRVNRDRGLAYALTKEMMRTQDMARRQGFWFAVSDSIQSGLQWWQFPPALIVFTGHIAYWVGTLQGLLYIRMRRVISGIKRS